MGRHSDIGRTGRKSKARRIGSHRIQPRTINHSFYILVFLFVQWARKISSQKFSTQKMEPLNNVNINTVIKNVHKRGDDIGQRE